VPCHPSAQDTSVQFRPGNALCLDRCNPSFRAQESHCGNILVHSPQVDSASVCTLGGVAEDMHLEGGFLSRSHPVRKGKGI
jgi:hypothetical protein